MYGYFVADSLDAEESGRPTFDIAQVFFFLFSAGVSVYLIWLGFAKKTRRVLSASYQEEVVAQTPRIENRLAGTTKAALVIMAVMAAGGVLLTTTMLLGS